MQYYLLFISFRIALTHLLFKEDKVHMFLIGWLLREGNEGEDSLVEVLKRKVGLLLYLNFSYYYF